MAAHDKIAPPSSHRPIDRLLAPFHQFARIEAAGGILLLLCTAIALIWANSSAWGQSYHDLWHTCITVTIGGYQISESLAHWVNDGLMAIFFFVVGLEIKRELMVGELATVRQAAIPIAAAIGGMVAPALVFVAFNLGQETVRGWAVPAATDIAFALGAMALLGKRVPLSLKIFVTALAIVDDIGAVLIIALFYTSDINWIALGVGGGLLAILIVANRLHIRRPLVYALLGIALWCAFLESGIHATIAGVLLAFTIPTNVRIDGAAFVSFSRHAVGEFEKAGGNAENIMTNSAQRKWLHGLEEACEHAQTPLQRLEHALHPWVAFFIMPVFALANAGVVFGEGVGEALTSRLGLGIILGLVIGKQIGVTLATWLAVKFNFGELPESMNFKQVYAASWLAGIGFTMSLFIVNLGFDDERLIDTAKIGVLGGSLIAGVCGIGLLWYFTRDNDGEANQR